MGYMPSCDLTPSSPACLSRQIYELRVMETKPDKAVSIIECDMNVSPPAAVIQTVRNTTVGNVCQLELQSCLSDVRDLDVCLVFQVDFDAPLGYKEPERRPREHHEEPTVGARLHDKDECYRRN